MHFRLGLLFAAIYAPAVLLLCWLWLWIYFRFIRYSLLGKYRENTLHSSGKRSFWFTNGLYIIWIHPSGGGDGHPVQRMGIHRIYTVCFENIQLIALVGGRLIDSIAISIINFRWAKEEDLNIFWSTLSIYTSLTIYLHIKFYDRVSIYFKRK